MTDPAELSMDDLRRGITSAADRDQVDGEPCTGVAAVWCPNHGTCTCPDDPDDSYRSFDDPACPLHSLSSDHPG